MRLWSIHPKYLDRQGLIALWREGLLAQKVLAGKTRGYKFHPQLIRFRECRDPLKSIGTYLHFVAEEASARGYNFNKTKILKKSLRLSPIPVTRGQLKYEAEHLFRKLKTRDPERYQEQCALRTLQPHPLFHSINGRIEHWERQVLKYSTKA